VLGIRPEDVNLAKPEDRVTISGRIFLVENLGMQNLISVRVNNSELRIRVLLPAHQLWEGEDITLTVQPQAIHWFDVQNGDRISSQGHFSPERARQSLDSRSMRN
jgi:multiple sugar transport system ATP-binding protein